MMMMMMMILVFQLRIVGLFDNQNKKNNHRLLLLRMINSMQLINRLFDKLNKLFYLILKKHI